MTQSWLFGHRYHHLPGDEEDSKHSKGSLEKATLRRQRSFHLIFFLLITILVGAVGYITGNYLPWRTELSYWQDTVPRVSLPLTKEIFRYNESFEASSPIEGVEPAWDSLIPKGLGYIQNPAASPNRSVISVFHQLHCLYTIRRAYYSKSPASLEDFDFGLDRTPHIGHCFEYLRQGLMCSADSSIEPANVDELLGWGVTRQCSDYDQLKEWAERWRENDKEGFLAVMLEGTGH